MAEGETYGPPGRSPAEQRSYPEEVGKDGDLLCVPPVCWVGASFCAWRRRSRLGDGWNPEGGWGGQPMALACSSLQAVSPSALPRAPLCFLGGPGVALLPPPRSQLLTNPSWQRLLVLPTVPMPETTHITRATSGSILEHPPLLCPSPPAQGQEQGTPLRTPLPWAHQPPTCPFTASDGLPPFPPFSPLILSSSLIHWTS